MSEKNIAQRIIDVMRKVDYVQKEKTVPAGYGKSYKALSYEDLVRALQPAIVEAGIIVNTSMVECKTEIVHLAAKQPDGEVRQEMWATVKVHMEFVNADKLDELMTGEFYGVGIDSRDKAVGKACTYAVKQGLRSTFLVASGEDPEDNNEPALSRECAVTPNASSVPRTPPPKAAPALSSAVSINGTSKMAFDAMNDKEREERKEATNKELHDLCALARKRGWGMAQLMDNIHETYPQSKGCTELWQIGAGVATAALCKFHTP